MGNTSVTKDGKILIGEYLTYAKPIDLGVLSALTKVCDVNKPNFQKETAILCAANNPNANAAIFDILIKAKANLNVANVDGKNALAQHIIRGNPIDIEALKLLISAGINVNHTNDPGWGALMHACYN